MGKHYFKCLACGSENCDSDGVKYFRVPENFERKEFWYHCLNKEHLLHNEMSSDYRVCERHFTKDMFGEKNVRLKKNAFPVLEIPKNVTNIEEVLNIASKESPIYETELCNDNFQMKRSASFEAEDVRIGDPQDDESFRDTRKTSIPDELFNEGFQSKRKRSLSFEAEAVRIDETHIGDRAPSNLISATIEATKDWGNLVETTPNVDEWRHMEKQQFNYSSTTSSYSNNTRSDRVRICKQYKKTKSLDTVAKMYKCSVSQVQAIVDEEKNSKPIQPLKNDGLVNLLDTVVYEWFQRAQRIVETGPITDEMLLQKALESVEIFGIYLTLDYEWVVNFRKKYNITNLDMTMLRIDSEGKSLSADINEVVMDVLKNNPIENISIPKIQNNSIPIQLDSNNVNAEDMIIPDEIYKPEPVDAKIDELPVITNGEDAKRHLKPLEDYVLLKENYRAIGLIAQLEKIFEEEINSCKSNF